MSAKEQIGFVAKAAGVPIGSGVGQYRWRDDLCALVRRNANGTDTMINRMEQLETALPRMLKALEFFDGIHIEKGMEPHFSHKVPFLTHQQVLDGKHALAVVRLLIGAIR